ncbi:MAG TPA: hypothetical protein VNK04_09405 [Gemmataceae bacterium]|jgi:hypothetical protein|nr:hypothetical protein [Gemmataceae bacterium]
MSAPSPPRPADAVEQHPDMRSALTRQQLDELDALLRRMLELPVYPTEEGPAPAEPAPSLAVPAPEPVALPSSEPAGPRALPPVESPAADLPVSPVSEPTEEETLPIAWWLRPILWGNRTFDRGVARLGRPGRWLRQPSGRTLLGVTGLVLLAAALALLVLDWVRWNW